ncbi:RNA-directed DNA polymerase, eukaryota [Tanacetum coccineum]
MTVSSCICRFGIVPFVFAFQKVPSTLVFRLRIVVGNYRIVVEKYWYETFVVVVAIVEENLLTGINIRVIVGKVAVGISQRRARNLLGCAHYYGTLCNAIHSSAKANVAHNFLKLKEGSVYSIKNFVVQANKEEYRKFRDHAYMIELDGTASVRKTFVKGSDVSGYVTNVGRITQQKSGSLTLDFSLANGRLLYMPTTLRLRKECWKTYSSRLGTEKMIVKIDGIRTRKGWNFPSCGGKKCKKGVVRKEGSFWCQACDRAVEYPMLRFRIKLDVSDKTASTVVVMFDEPDTELVKCSADSLATADEDVGLAYTDDVGFTCWRIASEEVFEEDARSSNVNTSPDINIK